MNTQKQTITPIYTKGQAKTVTTALLTATIGFLITTLVGYAVSYLIYDAIDGDLTAGNWHEALLGLATGGILISFILSFVWMFNMNKWSIGAGIAITTLFAICEGVGFGSLFVVLEVKELMIIFGMLAFILLGAFGVSKILTDKGALTLWKLSWWMIGFYLLGSLVL